MAVPGCANEDIVGLSGSYLWVFDGASRADERACIQARRLVAALDAGIRLAVAAAPGSLRDVMVAAVRHARNECGDARCGGWKSSAAGIIARVDNGRLEYLRLGDVSLIVVQRDDVVVLGDPTAIDRERQYLADAAVSGRSLSEVIQKRHTTMNQEGGYWMWSTEPLAALQAQTGVISLAPDARLLLLSDGLMRLVDLFGRMTASELIEHIESFGFLATIEVLRQIESTTPNAGHFVRAKQCDDASGLYACVKCGT